MTASLRLRAPLLGLGLLLAGLTLPRLGASGLWEPEERAVAEAAVEGRAALAPGPGLRAALPAAGLRLFGPGEAAARLPGALTALLTALLVLVAGRILHGPRQGWLGAWLLATMPAFVLSARQLTSEAPLLCAFALCIAGLGGFVVRAGAGRLRRAGYLALGCVGLGLGTIAGGLLLGLAVPALALVAALLVSNRAGAGAGRPIRALLWASAVAAGLVLVLAVIVPYRPGELSFRLGGVLAHAPGEASFDVVLRAFGFGAFPLAPLAFFALLHPVGDDGPAPGEETANPNHAVDAHNRRFADLFLLLLAAFALAAGTVRAQLTGEMTLAFLPAAALAMARFIEQQRQAPAGNPLLAILIAGGAVMVARDLGQTPVALVAPHLGGSTWSWPVTIEVRAPLLALGLTAAAGLGILALGARGRIRQVAPILLLGSTALLALGMSHWLLPQLGRHLSPSRLFASYQRLRPPDGALAIYAAAARGAPWARPAPAAIGELGTLAQAFRDRRGQFAIVPRTELARIDHHFAQQGIDYRVADASSSRLLLLAAALPAGAGDENPLAALRWRPHPDDDGPRPWPPPRLPLRAVFGEAIELLGADFPAVVRRPGALPLTLYFRARTAPPHEHQVFVHLERPGTLVNGDHPPLGGTFATTYWRAGDHLRDQHFIPLPFMLTPPGTYRVHVGFWPGGNTDRRLPVTTGEHDGRNRVFVGTVEIR